MLNVETSTDNIPSVEHLEQLLLHKLNSSNELYSYS